MTTSRPFSSVARISDRICGGRRSTIPIFTWILKSGYRLIQIRSIFALSQSDRTPNKPLENVGIQFLSLRQLHRIALQLAAFLLWHETNKIALLLPLSRHSPCRPYTAFAGGLADCTCASGLMASHRESARCAFMVPWRPTTCVCPGGRGMISTHVDAPTTVRGCSHVDVAVALRAEACELERSTARPWVNDNDNDKSDCGNLSRKRPL